MPFALTRQQWLWQDGCRPYMDVIMCGQIMYTTSLEVKTLWVCKDIERTHFFRSRLGWAKEVSCERWMRHLLRMAE